MKFGYKKQTQLQFSSAIEKTKSALADEGFGIISEIDVRKTFLKKLDKDFGNYVILGACHPESAWSVLSADKEMGLFLPCNVIVYENKEGVSVSSILPSVAIKMTGHEELSNLANEIERRLKKAISSV
jgi:uncharacterized protein (DUF302 family)